LKLLSLKVLLAFFFFTVNLLAQDIEPQMPSPTAATLAKYGEVPINLSTGQANTNIGIFSISSSDLSVPVSLSYSTSGIRVHEVPGWTGTGWTLNAGGVITRVVKDIRDELAYGYINTGNDSQFIEAVDSLLLEDVQSASIGNYLKTYIGSNFDAEQDVFYYNVNGFAGKFVFAPGGEIYTLENSNHAIEAIGVGEIDSDITSNTVSIKAFKIRTPDGTVYHFGTNSASKELHNPLIASSNYVNAWYLTKIESAKGDGIISFLYESAANNTVKNYGVEAEYGSYTAQQTPANIDGDSPTSSVTSRKYLKRIESNHQKVEFFRSAVDGTIDKTRYAVSDVSLDSIVVKTLEDIRIKKFKFDYTITPLKRMYLDSLVETGANETTSKTHSFEYYNKNDLPGDRSTKAIDHFGYYNGETSNDTYIPEIIALYEAVKAYYSGANREVDPDKVYYGALKKVIYPTGGSTLYSYEPNSYSEVISSTITGITDDYLITTAKKDEDFFFDDPYTRIESDTFSVNSAQTRRLNSSGNWDSYSPIAGAIVKIVNTNGCGTNNYTNVDIAIDKIGSLEGYLWQIPVSETNFTINDEIELSNGDWIVSVAQECDELNTVQVNIDVIEHKAVQEKFGGGLRIKKLESNSGILLDTITKEFVYGDTLGEPESWGILQEEPDYDFWFPSEKGYIQYFPPGGSGLQDLYGFYARMANPVQGLGGDVRNQLYYNKVLEKHGTNGSGGYIEHEFSLYDENPVALTITDNKNATTVNTEVFPGGADLSYRSGNRKKVSVFSQAQSTQEITEYTTTYYDSVSDTTDERKLKKFRKIEYYKFNEYSILFSPGHNYAIWQHSSKVTSKIYNGSGQAMTTIEETLFENLEHKLPTEVTSTNSLTGEKRVTKYTYAHEEYSGMVGLNMLSQPYLVLIEDGTGTVLSKSWTRWRDWGGGAWRPCETLVWDGVSSTISKTCSVDQ